MKIKFNLFSMLVSAMVSKLKPYVILRPLRLGKRQISFNIEWLQSEKVNSSTKTTSSYIGSLHQIAVVCTMVSR